ncbi:MAG TPA: NlpC/P60 family protein, partial [Sandaracinaceae bacterium]
MRAIPRTAVILLALGAAACAGSANEPGAAASDGTGAAGEERAASCPAQAPAPHPLPGVREELLTLEYWLARTDEAALDEVLLTPERIATHNRALGGDPENGLPIDRASLAAAPPVERLARVVRERLAALRERVASGEYVAADGARVPESELSEVELRPSAELRIALAPIPLRCGPRREGLFKRPIDPAFDRNNCSTIRPQEPVQVLMRWPNGMRLARTRYSIGWIAEDAPLSPPVPAELHDAVLRGPMLRVPAGTRLRAGDGATFSPEADVMLPAADVDRAWFADARGVHAAPAAGLVSTARPLTRRGVLEEAFRRIGAAYGWGGQDGGLDCSRFVMDVLAAFGLELPRPSVRQAVSGTHTIDLSQVSDLGERERLIDAAARRGIVLLHFPGHIMLYLGRDEDGTQRVIHSFSEYAEPCEDGGETLRRVDRVTVSDLSLGRGSSRRSFLERLDRIVVLGSTMGPELLGVATPRRPVPVEPPAPRACDDSARVRIFRSPAHPHPGQPLRVFVTATEELDPVELALIDPSGRRHTPAARRLGGPPFTYWAQVDAPRPGRWTVVIGDGARVEACEQVAVAAHPPRPRPADPEAVWTPRLRWEADTEALFSAFVEQLFDYPVDEDLTWPNLTVLLQDRDRNLLFNHLGQNEEERIQLRPDCADLPYFLRAYFAWKMRLPFGFRTCTRGRRGELPTCGELEHPGIPHEHTDEVEAFRWFIGQHVKQSVHSASGRTHPEDSLTALYP